MCTLVSKQNSCKTNLVFLCTHRKGLFMLKSNEILPLKNTLINVWGSYMKIT